MKVIFAIFYVVKSKDSTLVRVLYFHIKGTTMNYVVLVIRCYSPTTPYSSRPPLTPPVVFLAKADNCHCRPDVSVFTVIQ